MKYIKNNKIKKEKVKMNNEIKEEKIEKNIIDIAKLGEEIGMIPE